MFEFRKFGHKMFTSHLDRKALNQPTWIDNQRNVKLNSIHISSSSPSISRTLVHLHGLFGSVTNPHWQAIASSEKIRSQRQSILIDLRNHGDSGHSASMTYEEMANDVISHLNNLKVDKFTLFGHSFGSKVAMTMACKLGNRVDGLIIGDSAPVDLKQYPDIYTASKGVVDKVKTIDLNKMGKEELMKEIRTQFYEPVAENLCSNLVEERNQLNGNVKLKWKFNLEGISNNFDNITGWTDNGVYEGPVLVLRGGKSQAYPLESFIRVLPKIKPLDIKVIPNAGHWIHCDQPDLVIKEISQFLDSIDSSDKL